MNRLTVNKGSVLRVVGVIALVAGSVSLAVAGPVSVPVDFSKEIGTIRRLNGGNVGPGVPAAESSAWYLEERRVAP